VKTYVYCFGSHKYINKNVAVREHKCRISLKLLKISKPLLAMEGAEDGKVIQRKSPKTFSE